MKNWKTTILGWATVIATVAEGVKSLMAGKIPDQETLVRWGTTITAGWGLIHASDASVVKKVEQKVDDNTTAIMQTTFSGNK